MRQRRQMLGDRGELERDAARIVFVRDEQVDDRFRFQLHQVAAAIGKRALGDFEDRFEQGRVRAGIHERVAEKSREEEGALEAAAHVEKSPGLAVHHGIGGEADERGQRDDQIVEKIEPAPPRIRPSRACSATTRSWTFSRMRQESGESLSR